MDKELENGIRRSLGDFLSKSPLYTKFEIHDLYAELDERDISFDAYCDIDERNTSFKIKTSGLQSLKSELKESGKFLSVNSSGNYWFIRQCSASCQQCQQFQRHFLIYGEPVKRKNEELKFFIKKVGQYPPLEINPEKILREFLSEEDIALYKKAKNNLNFSYGIGAFAYFRRIVENEILNIASKLINKNEEAKIIIEPALKQFHIDHQMNKLIDSLTRFLPASVLLNNENPLKLLYAKISDGIHNLSEEECLERSANIEIVLKHIIIELRNQQLHDDANTAYNNLKKK